MCDRQVCLAGTTAYPGCASSATSSANLHAIFFSEAAWDNGGSLDIQPTTTMDIKYPYCVATDLTAGLPDAKCHDYSLSSPQHNVTFTMALALGTPRPLSAKSCFLLSGSNAFNPLRGSNATNETLSDGGWAIGTVSKATCGSDPTPKLSSMVGRLCRLRVDDFTSPYLNNTVVSRQVGHIPIVTYNRLI